MAKRNIKAIAAKIKEQKRKKGIIEQFSPQGRADVGAALAEGLSFQDVAKLIREWTGQSISDGAVANYAARRQHNGKGK